MNSACRECSHEQIDHRAFEGACLYCGCYGWEPLPVTINDLLTPDLVARRIESLAHQRFILDQLIPPAPRRRTTLRERLLRRIISARESLAFWIAPWLDNGEDI